MAEGGVLRGDFLPQIPAVARLDGGVEPRRLVLRADGAALDAAAVGDEEQVVLRQVQHLFLTLVLHGDGAGLFLAVLDLEADVRDLRLVLELHAVLLQVGDHGQDDGLVLVVPGKAQGGEIRQTADVVDIALEIELHLQCAVPVLEGKHGAPVEPEIRREHLIVKNVGDFLILQLLVRSEEELHDLHGTLIGNGEFAIGVGVLPALFGGAAEGLVGVFLVQPVILIEDAGPFRFQRGDGAQQIPHDLEVVVHLAAAAHHIADVVLITIASAAGQRVFFKHMDAFALHLTVPDEIARCGQRRQTRTNDIGRFIIDTLRLAGMCKGFVVATGIIHNADLLNFGCFRAAFPLALSLCLVYPTTYDRTTYKNRTVYKIYAKSNFCRKSERSVSVRINFSNRFHLLILELPLFSVYTNLVCLSPFAGTQLIFLLCQHWPIKGESHP